MAAEAAREAANAERERRREAEKVREKEREARRVEAERIRALAAKEQQSGTVQNHLQDAVSDGGQHS